MVGKNACISHVHEDDDLLQKVKDLLGPKGYRDGSVDSSKPNEATSDEYIKSEILAPRIRWASTMVVMVSTISLIVPCKSDTIMSSKSILLMQENHGKQVGF